MFVRLALEDDLDAICAMAAANVAETLPGEQFDRAYVEAAFQRYLDTANPTFFVCEDRRQVVGFVQTCIFGYDYRAGHYTTQKVL